MTITQYELWITDDKGQRITDRQGRSYLKEFLDLTVSRAVNRIGALALQVPPSFDEALLKPDNMIQVWRAPRGSRLKLWRIYFIRRWNFFHRGSNEHLVIYGVDSNDLLRRRIVAAFSGSTQAEKTDFADDMMKEIVTESIADGVDPVPDAGTRVWSDLSVQSSTSDGPSITKEFSFDNLMTSSGQGLLPAISRQAKEEGTEVYFDVAPNVITGSSVNFQFQTTINQPGVDKSDSVLFSLELGNLQNPDLEYDYTDEVNYIYGTGQGDACLRVVEQVYDTDRYNASQWNRCEDEADARTQKTSNGVIAEARDKLNAGRPKVRFSGIPLDTAGTRFGLDWDIGDKVTATYRNIKITPIIWSVSLSVDSNGSEDVRARLEYES